MLRVSFVVTCVGPGLAIKVTENPIRDALSAGAENPVTVCPTCETTLLRGASRLAHELDVFVDVRSLWDLLDEALRQGQ